MASGQHHIVVTGQPVQQGVPRSGEAMIPHFNNRYVIGVGYLAREHVLNMRARFRKQTYCLPMARTNSAQACAHAQSYGTVCYVTSRIQLEGAHHISTRGVMQGLVTWGGARWISYRFNVVIRLTLQ